MDGNFTVVFDACVLYPALLRNLLLQLATTELFRARWTNRIHDEWARALRANMPDITGEQVAHLRRLMDAAVPDCIVTANLRDFPDAVLTPLGVRAEHPDEFVLHLIDRSPAAVCLAIKTVRGRLIKPSYSADEFLDRLREQGLVGSVAKLREPARML